MLTYGYDDADQLTSVTRSGVGLESYDYDDAGNREMAGYTTGTANRLTSDGTFDYQYDAEGNRTKKLLAGTATVVEQYTWDYRNRLTRVTFYTGGAVAKTVDYSYDAFNHLIGRKVTSGGTTDQRYFVYDGDQMVLVMDPNGAVQNRYLWGAAVDEILADEQVGGELLWTLTDNLGTVRELVNNTSTVRNHIVYDTYGNVLSETAGGARSAIKFTGRYLDTETGLQWNLNRWYDAKTGRWMSQDPIGFEGGDGNLYRYVGNDPGNGVDPSGLSQVRETLEGTSTVQRLRAGAGEIRKNPWNAINPLSTGNVFHITAMAFFGTFTDLGRTAIGCASSEARLKLDERARNGEDYVTRAAAQAGCYFTYGGEAMSRAALEFSGGRAIPLPALKTGFAAASRGANASSGRVASNHARGRFDTEHLGTRGYDKALEGARSNAGYLGPNTQKMYDPRTGTLIGERSADGTRGWRIDQDHVNWWDWSGGKKGAGGRYGHEFFPSEQSGPHSPHKGAALWE